MNFVDQDSTATSNFHPALAALSTGLCPVPPRMDGSKAPIGAWKKYQHFPPDEAQIRRWYAAADQTGYGLITGKVSGNLELLEFDCIHSYHSFKAAADATGLGDLVARIENGYSERTPKPGIHWLYRCSEIAGNTKLATRPKSPEEMKDTKDKVQVLIETRGEGGYVIVAPSNGKTHPSGGCYELVAGGFDSIVTISPDERRDLFTLARTFTITPDADKEQAEKENVRNHRQGTDGSFNIRAGDDFNQKAVWAELLEAQGWTFVHRQGERDYWRRPGKEQGVSACTNWEGKDYFYCFSTSTEFEAETPIDKFGFYARTMHGGDFKEAVKALGTAGYGTPIEQREAKPKAKAKPAVDTDPYRGSDDANADLLLQLHGQDIRYCPPWNKWLLWNGTHWEIDDLLGVKQKAENVAVELYRLAANTGDADERKKIAALAFALETVGGRSAMLTAAQHKRAIRYSALDTGHFLLSCANGTVDLKTGQIRPHSRDDLITHSLEVAYNPAATAPTWLKFLNSTFARDADLIAFVQRAVGYSLTGDVREQILLICHGVGSNGKSVFLNIMRSLLGKLAIQAAPDLLMASRGERHPTDQADLFSKRLVVCQETGEGRRFNETLVKQLTGGDGIRARRMREDFWEFNPTHKLWLSTNHKPEIRGTDHAIWRRIRLVPFNVKFTDDGPARKDPAMEAKLTAELPGILAWAVAGCLDWQRQGLKAPAAVADATAGYQAEMDVLAAWLAECCVIKKHCETKASDLYSNYCDWCERSGEYVEKQRKFGMRLKERGFEQFTSNGAWWRGIGIYGTNGTNGTNFPYKQQNPTHEAVIGKYPSVPSVPSVSINPPPPPIQAEKISLSAAATELAKVFAGFRGWVGDYDVAKKAGWPPAQTAAALAELVAAGLAVKSGTLFKPVAVVEVRV